MADRAIDAIRDRFGWEAVGYGSVALELSRSVPDAFGELAERELDHRDEPRSRAADCPDDPVVKQSRELLRASRRLPALRAVNRARYRGLGPSASIPGAAVPVAIDESRLRLFDTGADVVSLASVRCVD